MTKPPETRPYELALLRGIFSPEAAREIIKSGNKNLFHDEAALAIFRGFQKLHFDRVPITPQNIKLEVLAAGAAEEAVIDASLAEIMDLPESSYTKKLIEGLAALQGRRKLFELRESLDDPAILKGGPNAAVEKINEFTASYHTIATKAPSTLRETMARILERTEPAKVFVPGLGRLDNYWKIRKPSYTVIGADSGGGKTALLITIMKNIAKQGAHVGIISLEMTEDELTFRAAAQDAGIDSSRIEDNLITDGERAHVYSVLAANSELYERIHIMDPSYVTAEQLPGLYNELITKYGCEVIGLDYIQRVGMSGKNNGKVDIVTNTSETITAITKSTGVATIALSVLNEDSSSFNGAGQGKQKRKGMNNLKNARQIGHDASSVVILTMMDGTQPEDESKYIVAESVKNRKGGWFCKPLLFHGPTQRFEDDGAEVQSIGE